MREGVNRVWRTGSIVKNEDQNGKLSNKEFGEHK